MSVRGLIVAGLLLSAAPVLHGQEPSGIAAALAVEQAMQTAIAAAEKSVVAIARVRKDRRTELAPTDPKFFPNAFGSGVVVDARGLILTNYHVLDDIEKNDYYVWVNRRPFRVTSIEAPQPVKATQVEAADPWMDLAILKIDADDLTPIKFGDADKLKKGSIVFALGNPHGIARDGNVSASWGIVSNLSRSAPPLPQSRASFGRETLHHYGTLIQTDARLSRGSSGGALVNLKGEMIGLTSGQAARANGDASGGFAIPVNDAFKRTVELLKRGQRAQYGFLGVAPVHLSERERQQSRLGARIETVVPGTPAAAAYLRSGDIITQVDGRKIYDDTTLFRELSQFPAGAEVRLTVVRDNRPPQLATVRLSKKHLDTVLPVYSRVEPRRWRGLEVDYATAIPPATLQQRRGDVDVLGCVAVVNVDTDSPAWKAGIRRWTFISEVAGTRVDSPEDFYAEVDKFGQQKVEVRLSMRNGGRDLRTISP